MLPQCPINAPYPNAQFHTIPFLAINLVHIWLDELQQNRAAWQESLKKQVKTEKDSKVYKEFEEELQRIEAELKKGHNLEVS